MWLIPVSTSLDSSSPCGHGMLFGCEICDSPVNFRLTPRAEDLMSEEESDA